jgi:hypothetical protein
MPAVDRHRRDTRMTLERPRRLLIFIVAAISAGLLSQYGARTQEIWREYRRDDLGFRVEMPGEPTINQEKRGTHEYGFHADILYNSILFSVQYLEYDTDSEEIMFKNMRSAFSMLAALNGVKAVEYPISTNGLRGQEFIFPEVKGTGLIARQFALNKKVTVVLDIEGAGVGPSNTSVRRFLESFMPLPR